MNTTDSESTVGPSWPRRAAAGARSAASGVATRLRRRVSRNTEHLLPVRSTGACPFDFEVTDPDTGAVYAPWTDGRNLAMRVTSPEGWTQFFALVPSPGGARPTLRVEHVEPDHCCPWTPVPAHAEGAPRSDGDLDTFGSGHDATNGPDTAVQAPPPAREGEDAA